MNNRKILPVLYCLAALAILLTTAIDAAGQGKGRDELRGPWAGFSDEQRAELRALHEELRDQGASRQEIRDAVAAKFDEWGLEMPEHRPRLGRGELRGPGPRAELSDEQRAELRETIKTLRENGATRREIRDTVKELIDLWLDENGGEPDPAAPGDEFEDEIEAEFEARNFPNPFNPDTRIVYALSGPDQVTLRIFNTRGQLIRTLVDEAQGAGEHSVIWDGRDPLGAIVPSGIYFYHVTIGNETQSQRMLLLK